MHDKHGKWADRPHGASTKWVNVSFMITVLLFSFIIILENLQLHDRVDSALESQQTLLPATTRRVCSARSQMI
mgnify:FL=1